jgi:hypothetical protein
MDWMTQESWFVLLLLRLILQSVQSSLCPKGTGHIPQGQRDRGMKLTPSYSAQIATYVTVHALSYTPSQHGAQFDKSARLYVTRHFETKIIFCQVIYTT